MAPHDQAALDGVEWVLPVEVEQVQNAFCQPSILSGGVPIPVGGGSTTPGASGGRARLTEEGMAKLLRLCILHQVDHRQGNKKVFWAQI